MSKVFKEYLHTQKDLKQITFSINRRDISIRSVLEDFVAAARAISEGECHVTPLPPPRYHPSVLEVIGRFNSEVASAAV